MSVTSIAGATEAPAATPLRAAIAALIACGLALAAWRLSHETGGTKLALSLVFGSLFGVALQRSRFCFACHWRDLLDKGDPRGVLAILLALAVALFWGAAHALGPGHGKSIVAAYLIGQRGTVRHAAYLGGIVTVTHTAGVFALGAITLLLSEFIVPEDLYPWLNLAAGLMVVAIGVAEHTLGRPAVDPLRHGQPVLDRAPGAGPAGLRIVSALDHQARHIGTWRDVVRPELHRLDRQ